MIHPDEFDEFYKDARVRLLQQTFALTGDLKASRSAVRDAFIVAWHHWRKVSRLPDPEAYVRPYAWSHAQRRHTARIWHRDKRIDPEVRATLEAIHKLPMVQRKALLLAQLATISMGDLAREIGLPAHEAERQLQTATAQFAVHRDARTTHIRPLFDQLRAHVEEGGWPRPTIVRRAGAARRRTHTMAGAAVAVAALVVAGSVVTDTTGVRPTLARDDAAAETSQQLKPDEPARTDPPPPAFNQDVMLTAEQIAARIPGKGWKAGATNDNTQGDGLVAACQQERFADPRGRATLVRPFEVPARGKAQVPNAVQIAELSSSETAAKKAFTKTLSWYARCTQPRVQLLATKQITGVADDARLLILRSWNRPGWTYVVGVARTGMITTTTFARTPFGASPAMPQVARLLVTAVQGLCEQFDAGSCGTTPAVKPVAPEPAGLVPGMLGEVDLPPIAGVTDPWAGTEPRKALANVAATSCDQADFNAKGISNNLTRSFLIPDAKLPDAFGLTETVGTMAPARATAFVETIRKRMGSCSERDLGTTVARLSHVDSRDRDISVWRVTTELSDDDTVTYLMGIARVGDAVAQVGFVPEGKATMGPDSFIALILRAAERLPAMPSSG